jgi:hypothetical protein
MNTTQNKNDKETKISKIIYYVRYLLNNIQKYCEEAIKYINHKIENEILQEKNFIKATLMTTNSFNLFEIEDMDIRRMLNKKDIETINTILVMIKHKVKHYAVTINDKRMIGEFKINNNENFKNINLGGGKKPITKKSVSKKPVIKKPASKKPVVKKTASKKPVVKKPVAKKPVTKKSVSKK